MSNHTAIGEWTEQAIAAFEKSVETDGPPLDTFERNELREAINNAINAALTAEWEGHEAAQRNVDILCRENSRIRKEREQYRKQLAAERQKYVEQREDWIREIQQLREQIQPLVDALKRIAYEPQGEATASHAEVLQAVENIAKDALDDTARAALAKVKEGK